MIRHLLLALALAAGVSSAAQAQVADVVPVCGSSSGVATPVGSGGRLTRDVNGSLCVAGISGGSGGGGTGGTVTQGAAAPDTAGNRWPVLAYQGGTWSFGLSGPIPTGSNVIGAVTQSGGPWTVSGAVAATQSGTWTVGQGAAGGTAWKVDGSGVTQPVSAANLPLPSGAATAALQSNVQSTAGTSASTLLTVQGSSSGVAIPVTGTFFQATQPVSSTTLATAANQNSTAAGTSATNAQGVQGVTGGVPLNIQGGNATAVKTDGSATTQPISASALPLPAGAATSANQSTEITAIQALNNKASYGNDFAGSLASGASLTGQSYTAGTALSGNPGRGVSAYTKFSAFFFSTQGGTGYIDGSNDGTTWTTIQSVALTASTGSTSTVPVVFPFVRARVVNGTTAATGTVIQSALLAN